MQNPRAALRARASPAGGRGRQVPGYLTRGPDHRPWRPQGGCLEVGKAWLRVSIAGSHALPLRPASKVLPTPVGQGGHHGDMCTSPGPREAARHHTPTLSRYEGLTFPSFLSPALTTTGTATGSKRHRGRPPPDGVGAPELSPQVGSTLTQRRLGLGATEQADN